MLGHQVNDFLAIFQKPFIFYILGAGKTTAIADVLINSKYCLQKPITKFVLLARHLNQDSYGKIFKNMPQVTILNIQEGVSEEKLVQAVKGKQGCAVLFDDLETDKTPGLLELICSCATRLCHHIGFSAFFSCHSVFYQNDNYRLLQKLFFIYFQRLFKREFLNYRNAQYIVFLQQRRELNSIANLSRQVFKSDRLEKAFKAICAKSKSYKYLILDLLPKTPEQFVLRETFDCRKKITTYHYV